MAKNHYLTNKDLLREIHNSKMTYSWVMNENYTEFDVIVNSLEEINTDIIEEARKNRADRYSKKAHQAEVKRWENGELTRKTKPRAIDFAVDPNTVTLEELVFRVMTFSHIPKENRKANPKQEADYHSRCNFPPYKHYAFIEGELSEVARSHWVGSPSNGYFSISHGKTTDALARAYIKLCERYSMRGNWRGYTYVDEMRGQALLQLSQIGLQFNEQKSNNPFAYYTAAINNSFTRVLNLEKRSQNIRDDLLEEEGLNPSSTRTFNAEWEAKTAYMAEEQKKLDTSGE